jgi:ubiquinone/menaquinone biosynthesis C-methylase UbiE
VTKTELSAFDRLAAPYDRGMMPLESLWLRALRTRLAPLARGRILEIGIGTGASLPFYSPAARLTAIDESVEMLAHAGRRAAALGRCVSLSQADTERLPFPAESFDTVVASLVLCSVVDQPRTLAELRRVLCEPDGRLVLLEHMRPDAFPLAWLADLLNTPWNALTKRCHLNRRTLREVSRAGFRVVHLETKIGGLLRLVVACLE